MQNACPGNNIEAVAGVSSTRSSIRIVMTCTHHMRGCLHLEEILEDGLVVLMAVPFAALFEGRHQNQDTNAFEIETLCMQALPNATHLQRSHTNASHFRRIRITGLQHRADLAYLVSIGKQTHVHGSIDRGDLAGAVISLPYNTTSPANGLIVRDSFEPLSLVLLGLHVRNKGLTVSESKYRITRNAADTATYWIQDRSWYDRSNWGSTDMFMWLVTEVHVVGPAILPVCGSIVRQPRRSEVGAFLKCLADQGTISVLNP